MFLGSLLDLSKYGKGKGSTCRKPFDQKCISVSLSGFVRERPDAPIPDIRRNSVESNTSRTYSDTSMGPPNGEHRGYSSQTKETTKKRLTYGNLP